MEVAVGGLVIDLALARAPALPSDEVQYGNHQFRVIELRNQCGGHLPWEEVRISQSEALYVLRDREEEQTGSDGTWLGVWGKVARRPLLFDPGAIFHVIHPPCPDFPWRKRSTATSFGPKVEQMLNSCIGRHLADFERSEAESMTRM